MGDGIVSMASSLLADPSPQMVFPIFPPWKIIKHKYFRLLQSLAITLKACINHLHVTAMINLKQLV